jgi:hypothetical protein
MAQTVSSTYRANALKNLREPKIELDIAWGLTADAIPTTLEDWTANGVSETARIRSLNWTRQLDMKGALGQGSSPVAAMTVELDNYDNRFSPFNTASPIHADLLATTTTDGGLTVEYPTMWHVPLRVRVGFENQAERLTLFTGLIDEPDETYGAGGSRVSFKCFDVGGAMLKRKLSTILKHNINTTDWLVYMLQAAGMGAYIGANMDTGLFFIHHAWMDDEDAYLECSKAAASEGGYFYFNELGKSVFRNAAWWAQKYASTTSQFTFTVARFTDITPGYDWKSLATGALVEYQGRELGGERVVWKSSDAAIVVPPGATSGESIIPGAENIEARLEYPCDLVYPMVHGHDWFAVSASGQDLSDVVEVVMSHYAQRASISFRNASHETAFILRAQLRGTALLGGPAEQVDRRIAVPLVPTNVVRVSDNPYIQSKAQADLIADLVADRMQYPRLTYKLAGVPAIPWLQLGDRITITATDPITTSRQAIITKLDFSWQPNALFTMTIDAVDAAGLFPYSSYFVVGTTALGSTTSVLFR